MILSVQLETASVWHELALANASGSVAIGDPNLKRQREGAVCNTGKAQVCLSLSFPGMRVSLLSHRGRHASFGL